MLSLHGNKATAHAYPEPLAGSATAVIRASAVPGEASGHVPLATLNANVHRQVSLALIDCADDMKFTQEVLEIDDPTEGRRLHTVNSD